ncbi:tRNA 5-methylaminomethyl-2-thiouridine synthase TusB [invertebrate metagenome]|uniref:tRNA 5-methylaminomethyl-2-thiouridine synthase TusB n=1 Tax=invertebrate metagenome TaxID=1711999 RepID=A0A484H8D1_9ZZZZ
MLHTVNKSPFERNALDACLARAEKGSVILLFEDAVYAVTRETTINSKIANAARDFKIVVLGPDLKARGYNEHQVIEGVTVINYGGFVDMVVAHGPVTAWL